MGLVIADVAVAIIVVAAVSGFILALMFGAHLKKAKNINMKNSIVVKQNRNYKHCYVLRSSYVFLLFLFSVKRKLFSRSHLCMIASPLTTTQQQA